MTKPNPSRTCENILAYIDLIKVTLFKPLTPPRCDSRKPVLKWSPPLLGVILLNSDAAVFEAEGCLGAGVVARDHRGSFLVACRQSTKGLMSPEEVEAPALQRSVSLALDEGYDKVIFASDCLSLIQRLNSEMMDRSPVGIKAMTTLFSSVSFTHVSRSLNVAAHTLPKSCISFSSSEVFYSVPDCIRGTFCIDVI